MAVRNPNYRLVKIHRNYTIEEAASVLGVHRNTVRQWIKAGLSTIDTRRPALILGDRLADFLRARRAKNKRPCGPGEIYCVRCRVPVRPAGDMVECKYVSASLGSLAGICPSCESMIYRRINLTKLEQICANLDVSVPKGSPHIGERASPSVNSDFAQVSSDHDNVQPR